MGVFEGRFTGASSLRIAIVVARFNDLVTGKLLSGCLDCLSRHGIDVSETSSQLDVAWVPGSFEVPLVAQRLAASRQFRHCGSGENLWMGTAGRFSPTQMAELWAAERRDFRPGTFPKVSRSGNWQAVGHYTQMVWRTTTTLGCAAATGADGLTRLVCHYAPPGNIIGQPVF